MGHRRPGAISLHHHEVPPPPLSQFKKSLGALVVFDITSRNSFASAAEWVQTIRERAEEHVQILLVGNKADLSSQRAVLPEEGEKLSREMGVFYVETTIHEPKSIDSALQKLIECKHPPIVW